jgi:hypothetical protein
MYRNFIYLQQYSFINIYQLVNVRNIQSKKLFKETVVSVLVGLKKYCSTSLTTFKRSLWRFVIC